MADSVSVKAGGSDDDIGEVPRHLAIIMDGNGRWAANRGLPRAMGHRQGVEAVKATIEEAANLGVKFLTLYAFSTENWKRPAAEVRDLMGLLRFYLNNHLKDLEKEEVRLRVIGRRQGLPADIVRLIEDAEARTHHFERMTVIIALNYGARDEIVDAARALATAVLEGRETLDGITEDRFSQAMSTYNIPDPDLIIRTSGEQRVSNFLLWQIAYAEFVFQNILWPDYGASDLRSAIAMYNRRERRFGARLEA